MHLSCDVAVIGGSLGGVAAALAACRRGRRVVLTEQYPWLGGQLTSQGVPPDEHTWVEQFGITASYRALREAIRDHYRTTRPLTEAARARRELNPGAGWVSKLCHEPRVAAQVVENLLQPHVDAGLLTIVRESVPVTAAVDGDRVTSVTVRALADGTETTIEAPWVVDATELGDLLPLTGCEYVTGFESRHDTGEPSAPEQAQPENVQAVSWCFAIDHVEGDHTIERPASYDFWRTYQPDFWGAPLLSWTAPIPRTLEPFTREFTPNPGDDPLQVNADQAAQGGDLNLWTFRRIVAKDLFEPGAEASDVTLVNWPQIDYFLSTVIDTPDAEEHLQASRELSLSMLYWMQTEAPRVDGGTGFPGLRLRGDLMGTSDGLAQAPYIRESRRIKARRTIVEQDLSLAVRGDAGAVRYPDSVGVGMYRIDLHPSTGGDNYIDVGAEPFEIPLGALVPVRLVNLLPGCKNIGTTHITNGCYRLHPVEWNIGEVVGLLADHCLGENTTPAAVHASEQAVARFQQTLVDEGIELHWPEGVKGY